MRPLVLPGLALLSACAAPRWADPPGALAELRRIAEASRWEELYDVVDPEDVGGWALHLVFGAVMASPEQGWVRAEAVLRRHAVDPDRTVKDPSSGRDVYDVRAVRDPRGLLAELAALGEGRLPFHGSFRSLYAGAVPLEVVGTGDGEAVVVYRGEAGDVREQGVRRAGGRWIPGKAVPVLRRPADPEWRLDPSVPEAQVWVRHAGRMRGADGREPPVIALNAYLARRIEAAAPVTYDRLTVTDATGAERRAAPFRGPVVDETRLLGTRYRTVQAPPQAFEFEGEGPPRRVRGILRTKVPIRDSKVSIAPLSIGARVDVGELSATVVSAADRTVTLAFARGGIPAEAEEVLPRIVPGSFRAIDGDGGATGTSDARADGDAVTVYEFQEMRDSAVHGNRVEIRFPLPPGAVIEALEFRFRTELRDLAVPFEADVDRPR